MEQAEAEEELPMEQAEAELSPEPESQPGFLDSLFNFLTSNMEVQPQVEEIAEPEVEPQAPEENTEIMEMHDCGHMMGNDDELIDRQIPFTPFHGLFELLLDEPKPMRHELPSQSQDPFFDLFFPF